MKIIQYKILFLFLIILLLSACAAPRVINQSGKVTPKGNVVAGASYTANAPTQTVLQMGKIVEQNITDLANKDTITLDGNLETINKAAIAYAIDPLSSGYDFYLRAGVATRWEAGYKLAGRANTLMVQYQFMGSTDKIGAVTTHPNQLYGSIGLQYSWQGYKLPNVFGQMQSRMGYSFKRSDVLLPIIFSYSFGNNEEYGSLAFGVAASYSRITYTTQPEAIFDNNKKPVLGIQHKQGFFSYGAFINTKIGYKYVYVIPACSFFYQNYGTYKLLGGGNYAFKGVTIIPSVSLQIRLGAEEK